MPQKKATAVIEDAKPKVEPDSGPGPLEEPDETLDAGGLLKEPEPIGYPDISEEEPEEPAPEKPEPEEEEAPAEESEEPQIDPQLLRHAQDLGLDAETFGTPEQLEQACVVLDRRAMDMGRKILEQGQRPAESSPTQEPRPQPRPQPLGDVEIPPALDGDEYGESMVKWSKDMVATVRALQQRNMLLEQHLAGQRQQALEAEVDRFVQEMGPEWASIFGEGPTGEMDPNSPAWQNRNQAVVQAEHLAASYGQMGHRRPPNLRVLLERAARGEWFQHANKVARQKFTEQATDRRKRHTIPPTQREGKDAIPHGRERAIRGVMQRMRELGEEPY